VGPYHWPADTEVKVYFVRERFTPEQRVAMAEAMTTWTIAERENGSGVKFIDAGETDARMACRSCLTIDRKDVHKRDKGFYAFFHPMSQEEGRLLVSAWIDLDFGITNPKALKGFMAHELAHGLGLWDCTSCKKKQTIMNGFTSMSKDNGLSVPSSCDLVTVRDVYQEERQLAAAKSPVKRQGETSSLALSTSQPAKSIFLQAGGAQLPSGSATVSNPSRVEKFDPATLGTGLTSLLGNEKPFRLINRYSFESWFLPTTPR
jgi:hypothetical protein